MSVYKLTCAETGKIYYGSTGNNMKRRKGSGWTSCECKNFINPILEVLDNIENKEERLLKENDYIINNECVNKKRAGKQDKVKQNKEIRIRIIEEKRFYCSLCNIAFQAPKKLVRHQEGFRHKLKQESYDKYGDDWKLNYLIDNKKRYNNNRRVVKKA